LDATLSALLDWFIAWDHMAVCWLEAWRLPRRSLCRRTTAGWRPAGSL